MKNFFYLLLLVLIASCGGKKSTPAPSSAMSSKYIVDTFNDVDNVSSYDPESLKDLPRQVDLKNIMTSVKDQDDRGTCSFFTTTALFESAIKSRMNIDVNLSEEYLNYSVKSLGYGTKYESGNRLENQRIAVKEGMLLERDFPYQPSWFEWKSPCADFTANDENAPDICFTHNKPSSAILEKKISTKDFESWELAADDFKEIITTLADKTPLAAGIPTHPNGMLDNGKVVYTEEMREECRTGVAECGSHAIVLTGYDLDKEVFYFKNSWSKDWGKDGYGELPFRVLDRHVRFSFGMVRLTADVKLPKDHAVNYFKLLKFEVDSKELGDRSVEIKTQVSANNVGTHAIIAQTKVYKKKSFDSTKTELVTLSEEDQKIYPRKNVGGAMYALQDTEAGNLKWMYDEKHMIVLSAEKMNLPTVKNLRNNQKEQMVLSTVLYLYTDEGLKDLSTITHPINYISYDFQK